MSALAVFTKYYEKLVSSMPMKDAIFIAKMYSKSLFPGDLKAQVETKSSSQDAAAYFLDNSIQKDLKNGRAKSFMKVLSTLMEYGDTCKDLSSEIMQKLNSMFLPIKMHGRVLCSSRSWFVTQRIL